MVLLDAPPARLARSSLLAASSLRVRTERYATDLLGGHGVTSGGAVLLAVPRDRAVVGACREATPGWEVPVTAEVVDVAPLPVRDRVRRRVELVGRVREPAPVTAAFLVRDCGLDPERHDVVLELVVETGIVAPGDPGAAAVARFGQRAWARSSPDLLGAHEAEILAHLWGAHRDATDLLARLVPAPALQGALRVVPLAVDALGLVLRVERARDHEDVRLAFDVPLRAPEELGPAMRALLRRAALTCPRRLLRPPAAAAGD